MTFVTDSGALGTTTQRAQQPTCPALKDVLVDMFSARPRKATCVVTTEQVHRGIVQARIRWVNHRDEKVPIDIA